MAAIQFRPEVLTRSAIPAPGQVDPINDQLLELGQRAADMPEDGATSTVKPPCVEALSATAAVRAFHWKMIDSWQKRMSELGTMLQRAQQEAAGRVPASGFGSVAGREVAVAAARSEATQGMQQGVVDDLGTKYGDKAGELAGTLCDSLAALSKAIDGARLDADSPRDIELNDLAIQADFDTRIRSANEPMKFATDRLVALIEHGKAEQLRNFVPVAQRVALEFLNTHPAKLKGRQMAQHDRDYLSPDGAPSPQLAAQMLLRAIADWRESNEPKSISVADGILEGLKLLFVPLIGTHADFMTIEDRRRRYYSDSSNKQPWPHGHVDPSWFGRYLPPRGQPLPGYSRIVARTGGPGTLPVRQAK